MKYWSGVSILMILIFILQTLLWPLQSKTLSSKQKDFLKFSSPPPPPCPQLHSIHEPMYLVTQAFQFQIIYIWKGPLPHKCAPVWATCVRESLGGVTGVGGDPNQVPSVGEFYLAFGMIFHGFMSWAYCLSIYFVILFSLFSLLFFVYCTSLYMY